MANISLADQLDDAIEMMIAKPDSALPKGEMNLGELLGIAAELRILPDPAFRALLKAELLGQGPSGPVATRAGIRQRMTEEGRPRHNTKLDPVLPSLFGAGDGSYPIHRGNFVISMAIHAAMIAAIATAGLWMARQPQLRPHASSVVLTDVGTYVLPSSINNGGGGGGGGDRDKLAESNGSLPPSSRDQVVPPAVVVRNEQPQLPEEPAVVGAPTLTPSAAPVGNPLAAILQPPSNGTGFGSGIGTGVGGGVGEGEGPGVGPGHGGGMGGGAFRVGGGVSAPRAIYDPDPEYSEEARQAKYQGTVLLWVIVSPEGRPRDIRVQRSLGMGLDEKAVEAVKNWKFVPSMLNGHPVPVQVNIEVSFRLY